MKKTLKKISWLLTFAIFFNFVYPTNIIADTDTDIKPISVNNVIFNDENTEEATDTTTEAVTVSDDSTSSSSIIAAISNAVTGFLGADDKETEETVTGVLTDAVLSDSAFDFVLELDDVPNESKKILTEKTSYSSLSEGEKDVLKEQCHLRQDAMEDCEKGGYSIVQSMPKAIIMQRMDIDLESALKMIYSYGSEVKALEETGAYRRLEYTSSVLSEEDIKSELSRLLIEGYDAENVIDAFIVSRCSDLEPKEIIDDNMCEVIFADIDNAADDRSPIIEDLITSDSALMTLNIVPIEAEPLAPEEETENTEVSVIDGYLSDSQLNVDDFEEAVLSEGVNLGLIEAESVALASTSSSNSSDTVYYKDAQFKTGPDIYTSGINDSVSMNTGELVLSLPVYSSKGLNGLDVNLYLTYKSNTHSFAEAEDGRFNMPSNWSLSFPFILNKDYEGLSTGSYAKYVITPEGTSYEIGKSENCTNIYGTQEYRYSLPLSYCSYRYVSEDFDSSECSGSKYYLMHTDGTRYFFDSNGRWIATYNRFGNKITLTGSNKNYVLTDTLGNETTITISMSRITFTFPDNSTYYINIGEADSSSYITVSSVNDRNNLTTSFDYIEYQKDNSTGHSYSNRLLTEAVSSSGLKNVYSYELAKVNHCDDLGEDTAYYPRVTNKYLQYSGSSTKYNEQSYTYDGRGYTFANSAARYFPSGSDWSYYYTTIDGNIVENHRCTLQYQRDGDFKCSTCGEELTALLYGGEIYSYKYDSNFTEGDFQYYTTVTTANYVKKQYFDYLHRLIYENIYYGTETDYTESVRVTYEYQDSVSTDNYKHYAIPYPMTVTTVTKNADTGKSITKVENYEYDYYGYVTSYSAEDGSGNTLHSETHTYDEVTYNSSTKKYDDNHYWIELEATYKRSNNEEITVENTLINENNTEFTSSSGIYTNKQIRSTEAYLDGKLSKYTYYLYYSNYLLNTQYDYAAEGSNSGNRYNQTYYLYADDETSSAKAPVAASPISVNVSNTYNVVGSTTEYEYDTQGNIILIKDGNGNYTSYSYDSYGNLTKKAHADSKSGLSSASAKTYTYSYTSPSCTVKYENGTSVQYSYDQAWNLTSVKSGSTVFYKYSYDTLMRPITLTDGEAVTSYTYDDHNRVLSETTKANTTVLSQKNYTYELNSTGLKTTEVIVGDDNCASITNITQADIMGRTVTENLGGNITDYTYDYLGNVTKVSNYISSSVTYDSSYTYDYYGNVTKTVEGASNSSSKITTSAAYDLLGRMTSFTDAKGFTSLYTYDYFNNPLTVNVPLEVDSSGTIVYNTTTYDYDYAGNLTHKSVSDGTTVSYQYDYRNRVIQTITGSEAVGYTYDAAGNLLTLSTNDGSQVHSYEYDNLNRVSKYTDALGNSETYTYDSYNNLSSKVDRNGNTTTYTYDGLHRLLTESVRVNYSTSTNTFTYGMTGGMTSALNSSGNKYYTYNSAGLVATESTFLSSAPYGTATYTITNTYDQRGNLTLEKYSKGSNVYQQVKYAYDNRGRLSSVKTDTDGSGTFVTNAAYTYDNNDNITKTTYGNGMYNNYTYNAGNLVTALTLKNSSGSTLQSLSYDYSRSGNIVAKSEVNGTTATDTAYTYDETNRLTSEIRTGNICYGLTYAYDNAGNRIRAEYSDLDDDPTTYTETYAYDKNNRLISVKKDSGYTYLTQTDYTYDNNGNQTVVEKYRVHEESDSGAAFRLNVESAESNSNTSVERFTYDGFNQLTDYTTTNGCKNGTTTLNALYKKVSYTYYADGLRASKSVNSSSTTTRYLWNGDNLYAEVNKDGSLNERYYRGYQLICDDSDTYYMHDAHGDITAYYNSNGTSIYNNYDAFGNSEVVNKFGYCDQQYDSETGYYYMRARYYDPATGRFISEDPIKDGFNWYSYCGGNPVLYMDINGRECTSVDLLLDSFTDMGFDSATVEYNDESKTAVVQVIGNGINKYLELDYSSGSDVTYLDYDKGEEVSVGTLIDGRIYMNREDLYAALGFGYAIKSEQYTRTEDDYNRKKALKNNLLSAINLLAEALPKVAIIFGAAADYIDDEVYILEPGEYQYEVIVGSCYDEDNDLTYYFSTANYYDRHKYELNKFAEPIQEVSHNTYVGKSNGNNMIK